MTEPVTTNKTLIVPNTGDLPGTWGTAALNPNFQIIDSMLGGVTTISLTSATTILLTVPATTGIWAGTVSQSSNALIRFTGAQTGTATIQFTLPGFYIIENRCTGTSVVVLSPAVGAGSSIGAPPGKKTQVFFDGTDMDFVSMPEVGERIDIHGISTTPRWMRSCSFLPYLVRDGSVHTASLYPQLAALLGSTFGGNGASTFGVPDSRSRADVGIDTAAVVGGGLAGRLTLATSGIIGTTMGAAGGTELFYAHRHVVVDPGHTHTGTAQVATGSQAYGSFPDTLAVPGSSAITVASSLTGISLATTGSGASQNVQPTIVSFLPLIKT